jgi:hypothetical protein
MAALSPTIQAVKAPRKPQHLLRSN